MSQLARPLSNAPWSIQTPCEARWEDMVGDAAVRHCARCDKNVYDLSAHSVAEAAAMRASPERPCIQITARADGAIRVREGWWVAGRAAALATALAACSPNPTASAPVVEPLTIAEATAHAASIPELDAPPELNHIAETLRGEPAAVTVPAVIEEPPPVHHRPIRRARPEKDDQQVEPIRPDDQVIQRLGGVPMMPD